MTVEAIIKKFQHLNITKVAVFDDEIEALRNIWSDDDNWESIFNAYYEVLEDTLGAGRTNTIRKLKTVEERLNELSIIGQCLTPEQLIALEFEAESVAIVRLWIEKLKSFELDVDTYIDFDDFKRQSQKKGEDYKTRLGKYNLILLDFNFAHQLGSAHSELISKEISNLLDPTSIQINTPPILIRFSSLDITDYSMDEQRKFVRDIGFARGCYDFLKKGLINKENSFIASIERIITNAEYGRPLYTLSRNVAGTISQKAATEVMKVLYRLDPESIKVISEQRLKLEGITTADYFTKLFLGLLNHTIAGSEDVAKATKEFLDSIAAKTESISGFEHEGLDLVQNKLLFDYKVNKFQKSINFGDIFLFAEEGEDRVGILITQACDMAIRGQQSRQNSESTSGQSKPNLPKVEYVMLLTGTLVPLPPVLAKGDSKKATLFTKFFSRIPNEQPYVAIKWNLQKTITLPRTLIDLASLNIEGKVTLPLQDSIIQSEWWSNTYKEYINWVCGYIRSNHFCLPQPNSSTEEILEVRQDCTEEPVKIVLTGAPSEESELSIFGSAVVFSATKSDEIIKFPIQRIARLQLAETLELQRAYHTYASRIGVMAEFSQEYVDAIVELYEQGAQPFAKISAKRFQIGDWSALIVSSREFEAVCSSQRAFLSLAKISASNHSSLNLEQIFERQDFLKEFKITLNGNNIWQIRRVQKQEPPKPVEQKTARTGVDPAIVQLREALKKYKEENQWLKAENQTLKSQIEKTEPD